MKKVYLLLIFIFSYVNAQKFIYVNSSGDFGVGHNWKKISPYFGLSFKSYFELVYDIPKDTLISDGNWDIICSPQIGLNYYFNDSPTKLYADVNIGTTIYGNNWPQSKNVNVGVGLGIEKSFERLCISGEIISCYSFDRYKNFPTMQSYSHEISLVPSIKLKYLL